MSEEGRDARVLRRLADDFERKADALAITYQDAEARRLATGPFRTRVAMLRNIAAELTPTCPDCGHGAHGYRCPTPKVDCFCRATPPDAAHAAPDESEAR